MALLLPFLLALTGGAIDLARVYQAQMTLESATRNAAEYAATNSDDVTAPDDARRVVCLEMRQSPGFQTGIDGDEKCDAPSVSLSFSLSETAPGASHDNPIGTATVQTSIQFQTVVPYPMLPHTITLHAEATYSIIQGRDI